MLELIYDALLAIINAQAGYTVTNSDLTIGVESTDIGVLVVMGPVTENEERETTGYYTNDLEVRFIVTPPASTDDDYLRPVIIQHDKFLQIISDNDDVINPAFPNDCLATDLKFKSSEPLANGGAINSGSIGFICTLKFRQLRSDTSSK